jgi:two-component system sensor histidine kinase TtrS
MEDTFNTGTSHHNIEYHGRVQGPDDIHEIVLLGATAIVQSGDKPRLLLCLQDVTKPRLAMDRAKQREAELAHVSRLTTLGEMATGLAHELNQPLSAILNYGAACSKLVGAQTPDLKRIAVNLDRIVAQADRAAQIMARIRAFAQRRPPRLGPVDLTRAVTRVIELLSWDIRQKGVDVALELTDALAPVEADAVQIDQVLLNLAKNAIEAMQGVPRNQRQLTIRTNTIDGDTVRVEVSDTGIGLPEENADRVFEAFFSTKPDGLGIGLSISRTIVEMHGGTLEAYNHPGHGCTFVMALPPARSTEPPGDQPLA